MVGGRLLRSGMKPLGLWRSLQPALILPGRATAPPTEGASPATPAVQQSVPAWLVFGMFFVVIPIGGVLIQERNEGTLARLATLQVRPAAMLAGKLLAFAASVAAVGLALLIASSTRNFEHAAALGGGLNVVLAAIAGVMVPRMLMPPELQVISAWSPMGWALDGMQAVFLGTPQAADILPRAGLLFAFGLVCLTWSGWKLRRREG